MGHPHENAIINLKEAAAGNYEHLRLKNPKQDILGSIFCMDRTQGCTQQIRISKTDKKRRKGAQGGAHFIL